MFTGGKTLGSSLCLVTSLQGIQVAGASSKALTADRC